MRNGNVLKICVSEICVKRIRVNQGLGVSTKLIWNLHRTLENLQTERFCFSQHLIRVFLKPSRYKIPLVGWTCAISDPQFRRHWLWKILPFAKFFKKTKIALKPASESQFYTLGNFLKYSSNFRMLNDFSKIKNH